MRPTSAPPSSTMPTHGSASSRNISSTRTAVRSASRHQVIRRRRARTTPASATTNVGDVARKIVEEHLDLCLARRHQPRRHQRRSGQGPVGIPDLRQGLQDRRRPDVDGPLPDAAPDRKIRHRHRIPLQAARRHRLERLRHARQLLDQVHARSRRQGVLREADGGLRENLMPTTSPSTARTTTCA